MVMADGGPTVVAKLVDVPEKAMGSEGEIVRYKRVFGQRCADPTYLV